MIIMYLWLLADSIIGSLKNKRTLGDVFINAKNYYRA